MTPVNYSARLNVDFSDLKKAWKQVQLNLKDAEAMVKKVNAENKSYTAGLKALEDQLKANIDKEEYYRRKLKEVQETEGASAEAKIKATTELKNQQAETEKARKALIEYNGITDKSRHCSNEFCKSLSFLELALYDIAKALTQKVCTALVDFTKDTINTGIQFESAFAGVRKVTNGTEEDFKRLENEIRKTALEKPISADQLASVYQMGSQLGIAKDGLKDFSNAIIDLAKTSDLTEEAGATLIAQYANVTKLPVEDYRRFASTLSYLGSNTATTESTIMDFASRISGSAKLIGMTNQEILALSTAMGSVGIKAEMGGSAISKIMNNIDVAVDKNNDTLKTWAEVAGMTSAEFANAWKTNVTGAFSSVISGMAKFKDEGGSLNILLEELDIKNIRQTETLKKLANASELLTEDIRVANEEWEKATFLSNSANAVFNTLDSQLQLLNNSFAEMKLSIYDGFKEPVAEIVKELNNFLQSDDIKKFTGEVGNAFKKMAELAVYWIKALITNIDKVLAVIKAAVSVIAGLFANKIAMAVSKGAMALQGFILHIISLPTKLAAATSATEAFNMVLGMNPAGAIAMAIGLLISAIVMFALNTEKATDKVKENTKVLEDQHKQLVENREERERTIAGIDAEAKKTQGLVDELKTLVDENGKVKDGYRSRVDEIIPLIEKATGTEIKLIDDQIDKYGELMSTLDKVIAKKRLEAKINAYQEDYNNAWKIKESNEKAILELNDQQALYDEYQELMKSKLTWGKDEKARYEQIKEEFSDLGINVRNLKQLDEFKNNLEKSRQEIAASEEEIAGVIDKYESLIVEEYESNKYDPEKDQTLDQLKEKEKQYKEQLEKYKTAIKNGSKDIKYEMVNSAEQELSTIQSKIKKMEELAYGKSGASSNVATGGTDNGSKSTTKKSTSKKEETHTSYQELLNQEKAYQTQLQNYLTAIKQGNSEITIEMVEDTKKKLDEVQKKVKDMKQLLGDNTVSTKLVLDDETYGGLNKKREELAKQLKDMQSELTKGNQSITQDMLNNVGKQIDQIDAKIKNLKNEWDESGNDGEISDEFESENTDHKSTGVIFGKGVIGENAVEMVGAGKDAASAYLDAFAAEKERHNNELVVQAKNQAQQEALSYQEATIDPNNLAVYDTTEKMLAESKQTSQAQGLTDNAYKVVDAETWTLNTAIEEAKKIDFKVVGLHICQGIADGIRENAHMVISAVRAMMAEANATAETEEEIESPSKVFYKYGRFMDMGMANGIKDYAKLVSNQVQAMTSRANEAIGLANSHMNAERYGNMQAFKGTGNTNINYNFTQNNTSNKSLDTLAIYQESKSMLKRAIRNQYV